MIGMLFKNSSLSVGLICGLKLRKFLMSAIYDKIGKLSTKSVVATNSGKLISLVSADIFVVERGMPLMPWIITSPITNIVVMVYLGIKNHWSTSVIVFIFYMLLVVG